MPPGALHFGRVPGSWAEAAGLGRGGGGLRRGPPAKGCSAGTGVAGPAEVVPDPARQQPPAAVGLGVVRCSHGRLLFLPLR